MISSRISWPKSTSLSLVALVGLVLTALSRIAAGDPAHVNSKPDWLRWENPLQTTIPASTLEALPQPIALLLPQEHPISHLFIGQQHSTGFQAIALEDLARQSGRTSVLFILPAISDNLSLGSAPASKITEPVAVIVGTYTALQQLQQQRNIWFWQWPDFVALMSLFAALAITPAWLNQKSIAQLKWLACSNLIAGLWLHMQLAGATPGTEILLLIWLIVLTLIPLSQLKSQRASPGLEYLPLRPVYLSTGLLFIVIVIDTMLRVSGFSLSAHPSQPLPLIPFGQLVFVVTALHFLVALHTRTQLSLKELNITLEQRVQQATMELQLRYTQFKADALDAAGLRERKAIYQSIHEDLSDKLLQLIYTAKTPESADLARAALAELRDSRNLYPDHDTRLSELLADIRNEIEIRCEESGIQLNWDFPEQLSDWRLTARQCSVLSRTLREAISNILKHAYAGGVQVSFCAHSNSVLGYHVADNGQGLPANHRPGRGLLNMHNRVKELGGRLELGPHQPSGTMLKFQLPTANTAQPAPLP
jgi:signal transduction histidine kinase